MADFTGSCLCGTITYSCSAEPAAIINCHCQDCRKALGAVHGTILFVPEDSVTISGTPNTFQHMSDSGSTMTKLFCSTCGSQMFTRNTNRPGVMGLRAGCVDDVTRVTPKLNVFTDSMVPTTPLNPDLPAHARMPGA